MSFDEETDGAPPGAEFPYEIQAFLEPLEDNPSGEDLEYDLQFMELAQAVLGKPETQFAPAEPPMWPAVQSLAEELMARTRDVRLAVWWTRAKVNQEGVPGFALGLTLISGLLAQFWDSVHPGLDTDDGDAFARVNALGALTSLDGLLGDLRQCRVMDDRNLGGLRTRDIEIGLNRIPPRADETPPSMQEIQGMLAEYAELAGQLRTGCTTCTEKLDAIQSFINDKVGSDSGLALDDMLGMVAAITSALPDESAGSDADSDSYGTDSDSTSDDFGSDDDESSSSSSSRGRRRESGPGSVNSRQDAVKAIQLVCAYLERSEPTNPAQLLLRRAERLIEKNFLELLRELAPNALAEVAAIMGVDPQSVGEET